ASSHCDAVGVDVRADGSYRSDDISNCATSNFSWTASVYTPTTVALWLKPGFEALFINDSQLFDGGTSYTSGYLALGGGGPDGSSVTVTDVTLWNTVPPYTSWTVGP
ncbi:MAG: hypothetical protein KGO05_03805, partial [Chloroflexota bacterium]|nr:hypothetical protein [Chloroflexota bacterium]